MQVRHVPQEELSRDATPDTLKRLRAAAFRFNTHPYTVICLSQMTPDALVLTIEESHSPCGYCIRQDKMDPCLEFVEFIGDDVPPYAILSHTWARDSSQEVTFQDMKDGLGQNKPGYSKNKKCGEIAAEHEIEYFWVGTCCIDKSSSAELTEAINSMYRWYHNAEVCYAYLSDVHMKDTSAEAIDLAIFGASLWFKRGWTLQELLAPSTVMFFSNEWHWIGSKSSLSAAFKDITSISASALGGAELESFSIAQRMSWAADRRTTRVEDIAYCLLGIFDVNMPLLYGGREKAFLRLQEEIIKKTTDQSIFAWKDAMVGYSRYTGLLALSPHGFKESGKIFSLGMLGRNADLPSPTWVSAPPFTWNNKCNTKTRRLARSFSHADGFNPRVTTSVFAITFTKPLAKLPSSYQSQWESYFPEPKQDHDTTTNI